MSYELHSGDEPVVVDVDGDIVSVTLGGLTVSYEAHRDADVFDDVQELTDALSDARRPIREAVARMKVVHARDKAMTVLYAMRQHVPMSKAADALKLEYPPEVLKAWGEWDPAIGRAREIAAKHLEDALRGHRWAHRGPVIGHPPQKRVRALDLSTGELVKTRWLPQDGRQQWEWIDVNDMTVEPEREGDWWQVTNSDRELPWDPWEQEMEYTKHLLK